MKSKKAYFVAGLTVVAVVAGSYGVLKAIDNDARPSSIESRIENDNNSKKEIEEQTAYIGGIEFETGLSPKSKEMDVINVMHKMTHQKVRSEDKWGAVPMTTEIINEVITVIEANNFAQKENLLLIAKKWKNDEFENIDQDHNYFWGLQGGTIGEAYGVLNSAEEAEFVKNNFK